MTQNLEKCVGWVYAEIENKINKIQPEFEMKNDFTFYTLFVVLTLNNFMNFENDLEDEYIFIENYDFCELD